MDTAHLLPPAGRWQLDIVDNVHLLPPAGRWQLDIIDNVHLLPPAGRWQLDIIDNVHLLSPAGRWQLDVILHTDIDEIGRSPNEPTNYSSNRCYSNFLIERYFLARFSNKFFGSL
jgi:subtilisin-like proprotein convertase family protein